MEFRRSISTLRCLLLAGGLLAIGSAASLAASPTPTAVDPSAVPVDEVQLLDPGAEPRQLLRYDMTAGQSGVMTMEMDFSVRVLIDGVAIGDTQVPTIGMDAVFTVEEVSADGTTRYAFEFVSVGIVGTTDTDEATVAAMDAQLSQMVGLSGWMVADDRGRTLESDIQAPDGMDPAMLASIDQMQHSLSEASAPLPLDPVGVGARWSIEQHVQNQGIEVIQTGTYTLDRMDGDTIGLQLGVVQTAEPGAAVSVPGMEPGTEVILRDLQGSGEGSLTIALDDFIADSELSMSETLLLDVDGQALETQTTVDIRIGHGESVDATDGEGTGEDSDS